MHVIDTRRQLLEQRCSEDGDVRAHISEMLRLRAVLASMGGEVADMDFSTMIAGSLPLSYRPLISTILATARVSKNLLGPEDLILLIHKEADFRAMQAKDGKTDSDAAMYSNAKHGKRDEGRGKGKSHGRRGGKANGKPKFHGKCHNCGVEGHKLAECRKPGGGAGEQTKTGEKQRESVNAAVSNERDKHAFTVIANPLPTLNSLTASSIAKTVIIDTGASSHMSSDRKNFRNFKTIPSRPIRAADGHVFESTEMGDLRIELPNGNQKTAVLLRDTLYSPDILFTLLFVSKLDSAGYSLIIKNGVCEISSQQGEVVAVIPRQRGLYRVIDEPVEKALLATKTMTIMELHRHLGHISPAVAKRLVLEGAIEGINLDTASNAEFCIACTHAKITAHPYPNERSSERSADYGDRTFSDVWGPARTQTLGKKRYYVSFTDDSSRWTKIYLMRHKSDTFIAYKLYEAWVFTQKGVRLKELQTDCGGEYLSKQFSDYLEQQGTTRRLTVHDLPQQNGVAERLN